jgi:4-hydroxy-4-methyl-2-oxoglutarate aldolase
MRSQLNTIYCLWAVFKKVPPSRYLIVGSANAMNTPKSNILSGQLQQLAEYDTALLANLLAYVDSTPTHLCYTSNQIRALVPDVGPTVGIAVTCELDTSTPDDQAVGDAEAFWQQLAQMESMRVPTVWVVSCVGSRPNHECIMGDGMGKLLRASGCVGAVTNGGARDLDGLRSIGFAVYGTGVTIHHCKMRVRSIGVPVDIGGITISPGDIIHANAEGVIRIPDRAVTKLLEQAPTYRAFEHEAHQLFRRTDLDVALKRELFAKVFSKYGFKDCTTLGTSGEAQS